MTFELKHSRLLQQNIKDEKSRLRNQNSNYMMKNTSRGPKKFVRFRWFFELCEFELKEFSCKGLLVNSEGTEEFVRFRWSFELQEFELHEFNCSLTKLSGSQRYLKHLKMFCYASYSLKGHRQVYWLFNLNNFLTKLFMKLTKFNYTWNRSILFSNKHFWLTLHGCLQQIAIS